MEFDWDEQKSAWTLDRRGFAYEFASRIFEGPVLERLDRRREYGESRVQAIGSVEGDILFVVYTDRDHVRRIISARRARKKERELWLSFASR